MSMLEDEEKEWFSRISTLFAASYSLLLILGTLSMAFFNFWLGFILFFLGLVLVAGNELLVFKQISSDKKERPRSASLLIDALNFAIPAFLLPSTIAVYLFFMEGWGNEVLVFALAGLSATAVKLAARTAQLFFAK
jgi:hypothetical protein